MEAESSSKSFSCDQCDHVATRKDNLNRHLKTKHGVDVPLVKKSQAMCQFPGCTAMFHHKSKMFIHMSETEFTEWKENIEADQHVFFSKQSGVRIGSQRTLEEHGIFYCQFDGSA